MLRGEAWVRRPVRPVGAPGSRKEEERATEARRRRAGRIVVVVIA